MNARACYLDLQGAIHAAPQVLSSDVLFEEIDVNECYVRGVLALVDGFELHIAEYVVTEPHVTRPKYRYHLQTSSGELISRDGTMRHIIPLYPPFLTSVTISEVRFTQRPLWTFLTYWTRCCSSSHPPHRTRAAFPLSRLAVSCHPKRTPHISCLVLKEGPSVPFPHRVPSALRMT